MISLIFCRYSGISISKNRCSGDEKSWKGTFSQLKPFTNLIAFSCHKRRKVVGFTCTLPYNNIFAAESVTLKFLSIYFPILASSNPVPYFTSLLFWWPSYYYYHSQKGGTSCSTRLQFWCQSPHYILWTQNSRLGAISTTQKSVKFHKLRYLAWDTLTKITAPLWNHKVSLSETQCKNAFPKKKFTEVSPAAHIFFRLLAFNMAPVTLTFYQEKLFWKFSVILLQSRFKIKLTRNGSKIALSNPQNSKISSVAQPWWATSIYFDIWPPHFSPQAGDHV